MSPAPAVSWRYDATTEPWLRALFLLGAAALFGLGALFVGSALFLLALLLWEGSTGTRLFVLLLALVGGPYSLLYLLPVLRDPDQRPTLAIEGVERVLTTRGKVAAGLVGGVVLAVAGLLDPRATGVLVGLGLGAGACYFLAATRGEIDPEAGTLSDRAREFDCSRIGGYRSRRLGPLALVTLSVPSEPGRFGGVPSRLLVPADRLEAVERALDAVVAGTDPEPGRDPNRAVRWTGALLALGFLGAGAGAFVLVGAGIGWYVAAMCGLFAVVFAFVAREG